MAVVPWASARPMSPWGVRTWASAAVLAALYVAAGRFGLAFAQTQDNATLIWAPTGLSLAALVLYGRGLWPGVFVGALLVNLSIDTPPGVSAAVAVGNTLEAVLGATLLAAARFDPQLARTRDVLVLFGLGALVATPVSATVGVVALELGGLIPAGTGVGAVWRDWWLGDVGGALVVTPLLLVGARGGPPWRALACRVESWLVLAAVTGTMLCAFGGVVPAGWGRLFGAFAAFPFLVWAGLRLGPRGAVGASALAAFLALLGTVAGTGPFAGEASLLLVWAYVSALGATTTILAAAVAEREVAEEARRAEARSRAAMEEQLGHAQRLDSLGLLAGGVAHDFNNLLVAVRANASLLLEDSDHHHHEMLTEIDQAAVRGAELCEQLLTYAGRRPTERRALDLCDLTRSVHAMLHRVLEVKGRIELDLPASLPDVRGDATQLRQVVMNLLMNAVEARRGEASVHVRVSAYEAWFDAEVLGETFLHADVPPGRFVVLEVADDGVGMAPETLARMFDPFFSTKRDSRGLGMAAVAGIVRGHGGAIKVDSWPGAGSRVRVLLPLSREPQPLVSRRAPP